MSIVTRVAHSSRPCIALAALAVWAGCGGASPYGGGAAPDTTSSSEESTLGAFKPPGNRRIANLGTFAVAYEVERACRLQSAAFKSIEPPTSGWTDVGHNELAGSFFELRKIHPTMGPGGVSVITIEAQSTDGERLWLRNVPVGKDSDTAARRWNCAVSIADLQALEPKLTAKYVQIDRSRCTGIMPILGGLNDISSSTYTVLDASVFAGQPPDAKTAETQGDAGHYAIGIRLEAEGGAKRLTLSSTDFDRCFQRADRTPPPPAESNALVAWLRSADADTVAPPKASLETVEAVMGMRREQCTKEKFGRNEGLECHTPLLTATTGATGAYGPGRIEFVRERLVRGLYFIDGKLVPPTKAVRVVASVRTPGTERDGEFARGFKSALRKTISDQKTQMRRAARGRFSLVEGGGGGATTHVVNVRTRYDIPDLVVRTEPRTHRYVAGKKQVPNPGYSGAQRAVKEAQAQLDSAKTDGEIVSQKLDKAKKLCEKGGDAAGKAAGKAAAKKLGGIFGGFASAAVSGTASAACNTAKETAEQTLVKSRIDKAAAALETARSKARNTPRTRPVDDKRVHHYNAKHYRRSGVARATVTVSARGSDRTLFEHEVEVPFTAEATEVPTVSEVGLVGKQAKPPSKADAERALAELLVPLVDQTIMKWGTQQDVGGDVGDVKPGTRSWMVLLSRQAATNRPIKLLSDILDNRADELEKGETSYPVTLPPDLANRCFTFGAIALDGTNDVNLSLLDAGRVVARDTRTDPDAAFELCDVPAGNYTAQVSFGGDAPRATLVSLFESTPGKIKVEDVRQSTRGIPSIANRGDVLKLDGTGRVEFKGTGGKVVVGATGDRDGDGLADDVDRCPYEPEVKNLYLDTDGCPDEPPPGWSPPKQAEPETPPKAEKKSKKKSKKKKTKKRRGKKKKKEKKKKTEVFIP